MTTEETIQPLEEDKSQAVNENTISDNNPPRFIFSNESLKKQMRPSEFFAEKIITSVAFMSIAIIILIFLFVFKETLPIFSGKAAVKTEIYAGKQESYDATSGDQNENKQEVYGGNDS